MSGGCGRRSSRIPRGPAVSAPSGGSATGTSPSVPAMTDLALVGLYALLASGFVAVVGAGVLRLLGPRSILVHICVLLAVTIAAVGSGVAAVAEGMFLSSHDLEVVLVTVAAS